MPERRYFNFSEILFFPIFPLIVNAIVSYAVLYFFGLTTMIVVEAIIALVVNFIYQGFKNRHNSIRLGPTEAFSYLVILGLMLTVNVGGYILVLFQETGVFYGLYFLLWLFVVIGLPYLNFVFINLKYSYRLNDQARKFTPLSLDVVLDVDYLIYDATIEFLNTKKELIAHVDLKKSNENNPERNNQKVSGRNEYLYHPAFSETVQIPDKTNRLKISWYSILEDIYYDDEIDFPFNSLVYEQSKYPTDISPLLRGKRTDRVILRIEQGGKIVLFNKHKTIIEPTVLKSIVPTESKKKEWAGKFSRLPELKKYQTKTAEATKLISQRTAARKYVCAWQIAGKVLQRHNVEIKDVVLNYGTFEPLALDRLELRHLPILFEIDYRRCSWLFIHIDAEKLYALIQSFDPTSVNITFDVDVDLESGAATLTVKNNDIVVPFSAWEMVIDAYRWKEAKGLREDYKVEESKNSLLQEIFKLMSEKKYIAAKTLCAEALQKYPFFPLIYFYEARLLYYTQGYKASYAKQSYFIEKTKQDPAAMSRIYNHYGCLYDEEKRYAESLKSFKQAYAIFPSDLFYLANIAEVHYKSKDAKQALKVARECSEKGCTLAILTEIISNKGIIG